MNTSIAVHCASWCASHVPTDDGGVIHLSSDQAVEAGPGLAGFIHVSVERLDSPGAPGVPTIRIEGDSDSMTPLQAFELATTLQAVAIAALIEEAVR